MKRRSFLSMACATTIPLVVRRANAKLVSTTAKESPCDQVVVHTIKSHRDLDGVILESQVDSDIIHALEFPRSCDIPLPSRSDIFNAAQLAQDVLSGTISAGIAARIGCMIPSEWKGIQDRGWPFSCVISDPYWNGWSDREYRRPDFKPKIQHCVTEDATAHCVIGGRMFVYCCAPERFSVIAEAFGRATAEWAIQARMKAGGNLVWVENQALTIRHNTRSNTPFEFSMRGGFCTPAQAAMLAEKDSAFRESLRKRFRSK